jgi:hypothetical protein
MLNATLVKSKSIVTKITLRGFEESIAFCDFLAEAMP